MASNVKPVQMPLPFEVMSEIVPEGWERAVKVLPNGHTQIRLTKRG